MRRRPPRSTRTDTLFPYTTLFRSHPIYCIPSTHLSRDIRPGRVAARWMAWADGEMTAATRSEEHTSELQSLMRISYAVFCLKKKKNTKRRKITATRRYTTRYTHD